MPAETGSGPALDLPPAAAVLGNQAVAVLRLAEEHQITLATAESCTGGLVASLLTDQTGLGRWFDRGFVAYTDQAKSDMLGIERSHIEYYGAVSEEIAQAMAIGALRHSGAFLTLGVTGFAGPAGPGDEPGLIYLAAACRSGAMEAREYHFGEAGRDQTRALAAEHGLDLLRSILSGNAEP